MLGDMCLCVVTNAIAVPCAYQNLCDAVLGITLLFKLNISGASTNRWGKPLPIVYDLLIVFPIVP